jgi:hypothetical protein
MFASVSIIVLLAAAPAPASPPSPKAAARAAMQSQPLPSSHPAPRRRGELTWLRAGYSLSHDPGFTPWSTFLSLADGPIGSWAIEGMTLGGGLRCGDVGTSGCQPLAYAILAAVWQPDGAPVGLFAGVNASSIPFGGEMRTVPGFSAGIRITTASLAALVKRRRGK